MTERDPIAVIDVIIKHIEGWQSPPEDALLDDLRFVRFSLLASGIDPLRLARAIRLVEAKRANEEGYEYTGPEAEWFDRYALDIVAEYDRLDVTNE
jgi:hypothetical protein